MFNNKKEYENRIIEKIQDPQTGENIHRAAIHPDLIESVKKKIAGHGGTMQAFISNAQSYFLLLRGQMDLLDKIKKADDDVKECLNDVVKKSKLDPKMPWSYNLVNQCMEYRSPPIVQGMTDAQLKESLKPGVPPLIKDTKGIVT